MDSVVSQPLKPFPDGGWREVERWKGDNATGDGGAFSGPVRIHQCSSQNALGRADWQEWGRAELSALIRGLAQALAQAPVQAEGWSWNRGGGIYFCHKRLPPVALDLNILSANTGWHWCGDRKVKQLYFCWGKMYVVHIVKFGR